jgi:hypothetical protein
VLHDRGGVRISRRLGCRHVASRQRGRGQPIPDCSQARRSTRLDRIVRGPSDPAARRDGFQVAARAAAAWRAIELEGHMTELATHSVGACDQAAIRASGA